jgi:FMN phosphatase YigB (HAD superfamily)
VTGDPSTPGGTGTVRSPRRIQAVFFDIGETLIDETRNWAGWADWLGVPRHTFSAAFGAVLARGLDHREVFQLFRPDFDFETERRRKTEAGFGWEFSDEDLYPDARPCLTALHDLELLVGIAGNQPLRSGPILESLRLPVDVIGTSDAWGVEKPSPGFFERLIIEAGCRTQEIVYVGDRIDNDVLAAQKAGLRTALIRRGPWGYITEDENAAADCLFRISSLRELPDLIIDLNSRT